MQSIFCGYLILKENNRNIENTFAFQTQWVTSKRACERSRWYFKLHNGDRWRHSVQDTCRHGGCEKWIQTPKCPDSHSNLIVIFLFGVLQVISEGFHRRRGHLMHASVPRKTWLHLLPRWVNVRRGSYLQLPPVVAVHGPASARVLLSKLALAGSLLTAYQDKALLTWATQLLLQIGKSGPHL